MNENTNKETLLGNRNEFLFLYDIKMGNPNGDVDENRPRRLPDNTFFVTDVRLKRFVRDYLKQQGFDILVDTIDGQTTNLTGRVVHYLDKHELKKATGAGIVEILLKAFIDARLFGSSLAFKKEKTSNDADKTESSKKKAAKPSAYQPEPVPKTLTGAVQINMGEILHKAEEISISGTSRFGSDQEKGQGTFTQFYGLRYGLIGFSGIANENSAKISMLSETDYSLFLKALWKSVRESGNTRTKKGQTPLLLMNIRYKKDAEFQFGRLQDYIKLLPAGDKMEKEWSGPDDCLINLDRLVERIKTHRSKIEEISWQAGDDGRFILNGNKLETLNGLPIEGIKWTPMELDQYPHKKQE